MDRFNGDWKNTEYTCEKCKWHGLGAEAGWTWGYEYRWLDVECPKCDTTLVVMDTGEPNDAFVTEFSRRKLRDPSQLPDIAEESFTLHWDFVDNDTVIGRGDSVVKYGDTVIFAEPAIWGGRYRFEEVSGILHQRYGAALQAVIPVGRSLLYLAGD